MKCPNDSATLVMSERSGVEIDYCPECRGVWLDRGELDKILDRAEAEASRAAPPAAPAAPAAPARDAQYPNPQYPSPQYPSPRPSYDDRRYDSHTSYRGKKKSHWLGELFD